MARKKSLIQLTKEKINWLEKCIDDEGFMRSDIKCELEYSRRVLKELEVLEILNVWLVYDEYEETSMTYRDMPLDLKEKIKEWLDNGK